MTSYIDRKTGRNSVPVDMDNKIVACTLMTSFPLSWRLDNLASETESRDLL